MAQDSAVSDIQWRAPWHGGAEATHHQTRPVRPSDQAQADTTSLPLTATV